MLGIKGKTTMNPFVECPACGGTCKPLDVVDFGKACLVPTGVGPPISGIPVYYYSCGTCRFCFAPDFSKWTLGDFEQQIYNDDYILFDPDYLDIRPRNNAKALLELFGAGKGEIKHLDYGGGNGLLSRLLRQAGWNSVSYDPFVDRDLKPEELGTFNLITAYEVFEHVPDIQALMKNLTTLLDEAGVVLFSTLLNDGELHSNTRITWWYASPRNGHISLFSHQSLQSLASRAGLVFHSFSPGLHAFWKMVPIWAEHLLMRPTTKQEVSVSTHACHPFPPYVELTESKYGPMLYPPKDQYVGRSFKEYGQFSQGELDIFMQIISPGAIVLDVGANIGAHTVPLAQLVGIGGAVVAFEPQPVLHQILCANLVLNSIPNVITYAMALGNCEGECKIPLFDYSQPLNFGGVAMDLVEEGESVPLGKLDTFKLERVDFIKLDVEGFESKVLEGAAETIERCRPIMYIENDRAEKSAELIQRLFDMGYRLWWHTPPLYSPDNFKANKENVFGRIVSVNMVAIHRDSERRVEGLKPILNPGDTCF
jgi:FkbM family methyltransferase